MKNIQAFASFLKQHKLEEVVNRQLDVSSSININLNYLQTDSLRIKDALTQRTYQFLEAIETNREQEYLKDRFSHWHMLEQTGAFAPISTLQFTRIFSAQKGIFIEFIPLFTNEVNTAVDICISLDHFYKNIQDIVFQWLQERQENNAAQLRESEERYKDLFDNAHDLIHLVEPSGKIMYVNEAWKNTLGYTKEEIEGESIYYFIHENDKENYKNYRQKVITHQLKDEHTVVTFLTKDGRKVILEGFISPRISNGEVIYTQGIFRNITEKIANEKKLKYYNEQLIEREENIQQLISHAPDGVIVIDKESKILIWNKKAEQIFGWKANEVVGKQLGNFIIPPVYKSAHYAGMKRFLNTGEAHVLNKTIEIKALHRNGEEFYISLTISQTKQSGTTAFISFIRDITQEKLNQLELERKRKELAESNKELEQYAWLTSHDLREPLRKILTYSDLLLNSRHYILEETAKRHITKINESAKRMGNLINAILLYSSITNEHSIYVETNLNEIVNEVVNDIELQIAEKKASIQVHPLPTIEIIPVQIRQLFQNLISNAIKYSKPGVRPEIIITHQNIDPNTVEIKIEDNGIGFDMKDEQRVFQLFQRLTSSKEHEGTGIGLALCKKIVQKHDGTIKVESRLNEGTAFFITLPVRHI